MAKRKARGAPQPRLPREGKEQAPQRPPDATGALQVPKDWQQYLTYRAPDLRAIQASWTDDVVRRRGIGVYEEMLYDAQVSSSLDLLKFAILSLGHTVAPPEGFEDDPEAIKAADLGRQKLEAITGGLKQFCYEALSCIDYGYSITETIWQPGEQWGIGSHSALPPALYGFSLDDQGRPDGVRQFNPISAQTETYGLEHFFILRWNPRFGGPYGRSQLRKAFDPWWMKQLIRRMRNTTLDRFGAPLVFVKVPTGTGKQDRTRLKNILENLHAEAGAVLDETYDVQLISGQGGAAADGFQEALMYEDAQIAKAITGVSLNANESQGTGTYAQSVVHQDNFLYYVEYGSHVLAEALTTQLLARICQYNLGTPDEKLPVLTFEPVRDADVQVAVQALTAAQQFGVVAFDEEFAMVRDRLGLPAADNEAAEIIRQRAKQMADAAVTQQTAGADQAKAMADQAKAGPAQPGGDDGDSPGGAQQPQDDPFDPSDDTQDYGSFLRGFVASSALFRSQEDTHDET